MNDLPETNTEALVNAVLNDPDQAMGAFDIAMAEKVTNAIDSLKIELAQKLTA